MALRQLRGHYATLTITERVQNGKPYRAISKIKIEVSGVDAAWVPFDVSNTFTWDGECCQFYNFHNPGGSPAGKLQIAGLYIPAMINPDGIVNRGLPEARTGSFFIPIGSAVTLRNELVYNAVHGFRLSENSFDYKIEKVQQPVVAPQVKLLETHENVLAITLEDLSLSVRAYNMLKAFKPYAERINTVGDIMKITPDEFRRKHGVGKRTVKEVSETLKLLGLAWPAINNKKQ